MIPDGHVEEIRVCVEFPEVLAGLIVEDHRRADNVRQRDDDDGQAYYRQAGPDPSLSPAKGHSACALTSRVGDGAHEGY